MINHFVRSLLPYIVILFLGNNVCAGQSNWMQEYGFVYLDEHLLHAQYEVRYNSQENFIGTTIEGYQSNRLVLTKEATTALHKAEKLLLEKGLCLKVFDTYRSQRAVNHFKSWAKVLSDTTMKKEYYPEQDKSKLFQLGYISSRSGHSRGSTIDLTLSDITSGEELDMGGPYDFFGELSHHGYKALTKKQIENRLLLKTIMQECGFRAYSKEWWHYTLNGEPYKDKYFDFLVPLAHVKK